MQVIYAANVGDADLASGNEMSNAVFALAEKEHSAAVRVSAQVSIPPIPVHHVGSMTRRV